jgi:hypothetical protein
MATKSTGKLESIFNDSAYDLTAARKSQQWFTAQINKLSKATPQKVLRDGTIVSTMVPGSLYLFFYDPKHKDTLPYYDRFPLVLPFRKVKGGFYGLNFHYLPPLLRVKLLDKLMMFSTTPGLTETTRLKFKYQLIAGSAKFAAAAPCVKMYLNDHVVSRLVMIDPKDWVTAMMLPVERFTTNKQTVWADSRKVI